MAGTARVLKELFEQHFGAEPEGLERGPGRVNLIGEHTDYNLGFVLPIAIDFACYTAWRRTGTGRLRVLSANQNEGREWDVASIAKLRPAHDWSDYVAGVARELGKAGFPIESTDLLIQSTVPTGAGLSSSAALEVSMARALLGGRPIEKRKLAQLCRAAENLFVGMPCGIMDQYISVFGEENAAVRIDCRSLDSQPVAVPRDVAIFAVNTMVKHELGQSAYRNRVIECAQAVQVLQSRFPEVKSLRDATPAMLEAVKQDMPPVVLGRARHIVSEDGRVLDFMEAAERADLEAMGRLFVASHMSLRDDYEVSCAELDFLVEAACGIEGVYGARMTGGGFGGCTVNLVATSAAEQFEAKLALAYQEQFGIAPQFYRVHPSAGAGKVL